MRRRTFSAGVALLPALACAEAPALGSHGMAVFGGRHGLYASHLPMFHAPHDHQVLLRFHLADAAADQALRERLATHPALWTLDPEPFDLLRLRPGHAQPLRHFQARLFEGHFERGGRLQPGTATVIVEAVLRHRRLDPTRRAARTGRYLLLGQADEWFAFKHLDRRPDVDHLLRLHAPARRGEVTVPVPDGAPTPEAVRLACGAQAVVELYAETEDLR